MLHVTVMHMQRIGKKWAVQKEFFKVMVVERRNSFHGTFSIQIGTQVFLSYFSSQHLKLLLSLKDLFRFIISEWCRVNEIKINRHERTESTTNTI